MVIKRPRNAQSPINALRWVEEPMAPAVPREETITRWWIKLNCWTRWSTGIVPITKPSSFKLLIQIMKISNNPNRSSWGTTPVDTTWLEVISRRSTWSWLNSRTSIWALYTMLRSTRPPSNRITLMRRCWSRRLRAKQQGRPHLSGGTLRWSSRRLGSSRTPRPSNISSGWIRRYQWMLVAVALDPRSILKTSRPRNRGLISQILKIGFRWSTSEPKVFIRAKTWTLSSICRSSIWPTRALTSKSPRWRRPRPRRRS